MTRINCVPVVELCDQHLVAEWTELPRAFSKINKRLKAGKGFDDVPPTYRMGKGHETFFFDKAFWLITRLGQIRDEMRHRHINANDAWLDKWLLEVVDMPSNVYGAWLPAPRDQQVNRERLYERIRNMKPLAMWSCRDTPFYARHALEERAEL